MTKEISHFNRLQAEYGRAMHVLLNRRQQLPWRLMQTLWEFAESRAFRAAFLDDLDAVTDFQSLTLMDYFHSSLDNPPLDRQELDNDEDTGQVVPDFLRLQSGFSRWMGLEQIGFLRISVSDDRTYDGASASGILSGGLLGYIAESASSLAQDIAAWSKGRDSAPEPLSIVEMENVPIRLTQLEGVLAELRKIIIVQDWRQEYLGELNLVNDELEESEHLSPSLLFVDPICLADASLHATYEDQDPGFSTTFLSELTNWEDWDQIWTMEQMRVPDSEDPSIYLQNSTIGALDFYVTSLPQRRWDSLTSKKPEPEMSPIKPPSSREFFSRMSSITVSRCLHAVEDMFDLLEVEDFPEYTQGNISLYSRLLHIKARITLGGEAPGIWFTDRTISPNQLAEELLEKALELAKKGQDRRHVLRIEIDHLIARSRENTIQFSAAFERLQVLASELGETELGHAVELNRIQIMHSGEEREQLLKEFKNTKENMSKWTENMCDYLLAFNNDCQQTIGFRIRVLYSIQLLDMLRAHNLWQSIVTAGPDRNDRHPLHAREIICQIHEEWGREGPNTLPWHVHDFIDELSSDYYRFLASWLPEDTRRSSPILELGYFERLVSDFDKSRDNLIEIVESRGRRYRIRPSSPPEPSDPRTQERLDKTWREIWCMAGIALIFGTKEKLNLTGSHELSHELGLGFHHDHTYFASEDELLTECWDAVLANLLSGNTNPLSRFGDNGFLPTPSELKDHYEDSISEVKTLNDFQLIVKYLAYPEVVLREAVTRCNDAISPHLPLSEELPNNIRLKYLGELVKLNKAASWVSTTAIPNLITNPDILLDLFDELDYLQDNHKRISSIDTRLNLEIREIAEALIGVNPETRDEHYVYARALDWMDEVSYSLRLAQQHLPDENFISRWPHLTEDPKETNLLRYLDLKSRLTRHRVFHNGGYSKMYNRQLQDLLFYRGLSSKGPKKDLVERLISDDGNFIESALSESDINMLDIDTSKIHPTLLYARSGHLYHVISKLLDYIDETNLFDEILPHLIALAREEFNQGAETPPQHLSSLLLKEILSENPTDLDEEKLQFIRSELELEGMPSWLCGIE